jgi:predicted MPP superfamily phosphohydrolase
MISRRTFLRIAGVGATASTGIGLYTWLVEPHWLQITQRLLPIRDLPQPLIGSRLVQISDLHVGPWVSDDYILESFKRVEAIQPEFVVYPGDFTSYAADVFDHADRVFHYLPTGRIGTFGILGNHDYGPGWSRPEVADEIAEIVTAHGVKVLRNQLADIEGLQILGFDDLWAHRFDLQATLKDYDSHRPAIALSHNPDTVDLDDWAPFEGWILSGHTHGGQCKPPFLPPPLLPVRNKRYTCGEFDLLGNRKMYISRGVGHLIQARFNVRPEITVFTLARA